MHPPPLADPPCPTTSHSAFIVATTFSQRIAVIDEISMSAAGLRLGLSWISIWLFMFVEHQQLLECNSFDSIHIADQWYLFVNCLQLQMESSIKETTNIAVLRSGMPPIKSQTYRKSSNLLTATKAGWFVRSFVSTFVHCSQPKRPYFGDTNGKTDRLTDWQTYRFESM